MSKRRTQTVFDIIIPMGTPLKWQLKIMYAENKMTAFLIGRTSGCSEASWLGRGQCDLSPFMRPRMLTFFLFSCALMTFQ